MLQPQKPSASPFPSSPAGSNFTPRKEFIPTPPRQSSTFALLAFSSNNAIRLSNFPQPLVTALRDLLNVVIGLRSFRENAEHKLAEIILTGKPWSRSKSLSTEIVLVQVFNVLLAHGYGIVSHLDYGREHNDRLSLAFSRLVPIPGEAQQSTQPRLVSFGLSFPSPTVLRVVCPPLHATPAILQAVRGAWPRGINNEKKLGEGCYEFKLKGYSWFSEDTFPEDSLAHTLTILTGLDRQGCKLLISLALTASRPRNKDLWLFSAPGPGAASIDAYPDAMMESPVRLGSPLKPSSYEPIVDHTVEGSGDSEGTGPMEANNDKAHTRGATVDLERPNILTRGGHTRSPSDTVPIDLHKKAAPKPTLDDEHVHAPPTTYPPPSHDIIPGMPPPPDIIYTASQLAPSPPRAQTDTIHVSDLPQRFPAQDAPPEPQSPLGVPPSHPLVSLPEAAERHPLEEDFPQHGIPADAKTHHSNTSTPTLRAPDLPTPPLLPPVAFRTPSGEPRDSGFSVGTGHSFDVPITWVPTTQPPPSAFLNIDARTEGDRSSITTGPLPPGGWSSTPAVEEEDSMALQGAYQSAGTGATPRVNTNVMPERRDALSPHSPEVVRPALPDDNPDGVGQEALRKSEAGVLGVMPSPAQEGAPRVSPVSIVNGHAGDDVQKDTEKPKEGWVLVSVGQEESPAPIPVLNEPEPQQTPTTQVPVSTSQLIAAADATEAASPSPPASSGHTKSPSTLGRLFSRSNRKDGGVQKTRSVEREADTEKDKNGRFRRKGVLSTLRSGKRRSID